MSYYIYLFQCQQKRNIISFGRYGGEVELYCIRLTGVPHKVAIECLLYPG